MKAKIKGSIRTQTVGISVLFISMTAGAIQNVAAQSNHVSGAGLLAAWNDVALEWVRQSERGPTISGRFTAYTNIAMYEAWAVFEESTSGITTSLDPIRVTTLAPMTRDVVRNVAIGQAAHKVLNEIGKTVLRQEYLEVENNEFADQRLAVLQAESDALLQAALDSMQTQLPANVDKKNALAISSSVSSAVVDSVMASAAADGSNQGDDYKDTTSYQVTSWVDPVPDVSDGIRDYDFLHSGYTYNFFNPVTASATPNVGNALVHPKILSGELTLTDTYQSLTQLGVFPPAADGGPQTPLTPHWGKVATLVLDNGSALRPSSVVGPYDSSGSLNPQWVAEARQLLDFAAVMQDAAPGSALQRATSEYWELGDATEYPPGWWLQRASDLAVSRDLSQREAMRMLLAVSIATFEAGVSSWETKYHFDSVRPITAINELFYGSTVPDWRGEQIANTDDRDHWRPYQLRRNLTPPFPDIVSGHSSFSTAAVTSMQQILGSNFFGFTTHPFESRFDLTDGFDGDPTSGNEAAVLSWDYLSSAAEEAGLSRLYGGIHMMEGNQLGLNMGTRLGHMTVAYVDGLLGKTPKQMPSLVFGSGQSDANLTTPADTCGAAEVFGFHDNDHLYANMNCDEPVSLFGGEGNDTFIIGGLGDVWIQDYEFGDTIEIQPSRVTGTSSAKGKWVDGYSLLVEQHQQVNGPAVKLSVNGNTAVFLEGDWTLDDLQVRVQSTPMQQDLVCVDTDGDGWGWDGAKPCNMPTDVDITMCRDPDGDGWGWTGTESCLVGVEPPVIKLEPVTTDEAIYTNVLCIDSDGDGWGWQEPAGYPSLARSCRLPSGG